GQGRTHLAYWPGSLQTYDKTGRYVQTVNDLLGSRDWQARFSADGRFLAGVGEGGVVRVWDVGSRGPVTPVLRHGASVAGVAFVPGGRLFLAGCSDGTVRVWDLAMGYSPAWSKDLGLSHVDYLPDGRAVAYGDGRATVFDPATGQRQGPVVDGRGEGA